MKEYDEAVTTADDLALDRHLLSLQRFAPRPGFADRVMARVSLRAPALVRAERLARALVTPRRLWLASGLAAAGSVTWLVAIGNWISGGGMAGAGAWVSAQVSGAMTAGLLQVSAVASNMLTGYAVSAYRELGNTLYAVLAAAMLLPVLSSGGLYLTLRQNSAKRIGAYAVR